MPDPESFHQRAADLAALAAATVHAGRERVARTLPTAYTRAELAPGAP